MKKLLSMLVALVALFGVFSLKADAAGTGDLVIHFQSWTQDYEDLGSHVWGGDLAGKLKDGVDDFGAYWEYNAVPTGLDELGFIAVKWVGEGPNWDAKKTGDVKIAPTVIQEGKTVHVYIFEGAVTTADNDDYFVANPDKYNALVVYYDPSNTYSETLGIHGWGWNGDAGSSSWGTPTPVLVNAGKSEAGYPVKAFLLTADAGSPGFLMYGGDDATKKTGDLKSETGFFTDVVVGTTDIVYIVNVGDGVSDNSNVFTDAVAFAEKAFSFTLIPGDIVKQTGTYAIDPHTIFVQTGSSIASPYPKAEDKDAARATIESWFTIKEVVTPATETEEAVYGDALVIDHVDFAQTAESLNNFVVILAENSPIDNTKQYEVFFELFPTVTKEVTIQLTAPANTPAEAELSVAGSFQGWTPGVAEYTATKVGDVYKITFTVDINQPLVTFEYKWTRGAWDTEEYVADNRKINIYYEDESVLVEDVVEAWADIEAPAEKYPAPDRPAELPAQAKVKASLELMIDSEAPVIEFVDLALVGKLEAERIITVPWGQKFDTNKFPNFEANDNRDGNISVMVYVPSGEFSILDTRTEGDYVIMLRVEDKWGNVTEEKFTFRVVK